MNALMFSNLRYLVSLLFGLLLTFQIADVLKTHKNRMCAAVFTILVLIFQAAGYLTLGDSIGRQIYPVLVHVPLVIFLIIIFRKHWLIAIASVLSAYFCCQVPNWISKFFVQIFFEYSFVALLEFLLYSISVAVFIYIFMHWLVLPSRDLVHSSRKSLLVYTTLPLIYYIFDYMTTVYSDLLYQGNWIVVQFMPTVSCVVYFLTVIAYQKESQKQADIQLERDLLASQIQQAQTQLSSLQHIKLETANIRHDMRHHLSLLKGYLLNNNTEQALKYLDETEEQITAITPQKYCGNEAVNLICSHFALRANELSCEFHVNIRLPEELPLKDTELCVLLSNSLENAIHAVESLPASKRIISLEMKEFRGQLLIAEENSYLHSIVIRDGMPDSSEPGHGFGVRSITAIVYKHKGNILFTTEENMFKLQAVIPLRT